MRLKDFIYTLDFNKADNIIIWDEDNEKYAVVFSFEDLLYDTYPAVCKKLWDKEVDGLKFYDYNGINNYEIRICSKIKMNHC